MRWWRYKRLSRHEAELLEKVARSFALTIRLLPGPIRDPVGLAYLLARAADSVADIGFLPAVERLELLGALESCIQEGRRVPDRIIELGLRAGSKPEIAILAELPRLIQHLEELGQLERNEIRRVLAVIISGQRLDLERFELQGRGTLRTADELIDYTYRVAGCVGEFWSRLCNGLLLRRGREYENRLSALGRLYGQGLQLVNVLRDLPFDLQRGRCYLPETELIQHGVTAMDLFDGRGWERARPIFERWLALARRWLGEGWEYVQSLPYSAWRLRIATALPALLGMRTLQLVESASQGAYLQSSHPVKVGRKELYRLLAQSMWRVFIPPMWEALWKRSTLA